MSTESWNFDDGTFQGWTPINPTYCTITTEQSHSPDYSVKCNISSGYMRFYKNFDLSDVTGVILRFWGLWISGNAGLQVQLYDNETGEVIHTFPTTKPSVWTQEEYDLSPYVAGKSNVQIRIGSVGVGVWVNGYVDDVELELLVPGVPTVSTLPAGEITLTSAKLNGEITTLFPTPCDERGFEWGVESGVYPYSWTETDGFGVEAFSHDLTGLEEDTPYYFRAKAHNSEGWGYGAEESFRTGTPTTTEMDVRLSDVDPPEEEPKRTIYRDIVNLPDPVKLGITIRYFNHDDVGLYFQITGSAAGYTFGTVNLNGGAVLGSGTDKYENLDAFVSRVKPSVGDLPLGEMDENITLILKAYTDAGYSNLKWTFERVVGVHWINSADAAFTVDELDNFDDGTVQGWEIKKIDELLGFSVSRAVAVDYVLSAPYSLKGVGDWTKWTPDPPTYPKNERITSNGVALIFIGRPYDANTNIYCPVNKWIKILAPLPTNTTIELQVFFEVATVTLTPGHQKNSFCLYKNITTPNKNAVYAVINVRFSRATGYAYIWMDDFKIISK